MAKVDWKWKVNKAGRTVFSANEVARSAAATSEAWGDVSMLRTDSTWLSSCKRGWARGPPPTDPCESELLLRLAGVSTPDRTVPFCMVEGWCELAPSEYASAERARLPEELMISKSSKNAAKMECCDGNLCARCTRCRGPLPLPHKPAGQQARTSLQSASAQRKLEPSLVGQAKHSYVSEESYDALENCFEVH